MRTLLSVALQAGIAVAGLMVFKLAYERGFEDGYSEGISENEHEIEDYAEDCGIPYEVLRRRINF